MLQSFGGALERHLDALRSKDIDVFLETLPQDGPLTLILPNGKLLSNAQDVIAFHRDWFADEDWSIETHVLRTIVGSEVAAALVRVEYNDLDRQGKPISQTYFLNIIFQRQDDRWLLVHDQNTTIQ